ncbi:MULTISPECIES: hypothetical protein [unclassified Kribbella]|uniref:hypothetical protein n=1 Tax=unclassified Kribbella TaxID=2644121 RepID=UPI00301ADC4B
MSTTSVVRRQNINDGDLTVEASPTRTTQGGVVRLTAKTSTLSGRYSVDWTVTGPAVLPEHERRVVLLGTTTVHGSEIDLPDDDLEHVLEATLDTGHLMLGSWIVGIRLTRVYTVTEQADAAAANPPPANGAGGPANAGGPPSTAPPGNAASAGSARPAASTAPPANAAPAAGGSGPANGAATNDDDYYEAETGPIEVAPRPFAAGDDVAVTMKRTAVPPTADQALWVAIRNSTNALGFDNYSDFLDRVMCGESSGGTDPGISDKDLKDTLHRVKRRTALPFPNVDRYRLLKAATEVFLMIHCGVDADGFSRLRLDLNEESRRLSRTVRPGDIEAEWREYLVRVAAGDYSSLEILPYLELIRLKLRDVPVVGLGQRDSEAEVCYGILADKLSNPCFLELLWSYWNDESGLVQTINSITWRFQNRSQGPPGRDPLAGLAIDPLRPLNNLLWGWIQDTQHRLTTTRLALEYSHEYGLALASRPGPPVRGADARTRFIEALHNLLRLCAIFYHYDDDTTRIADGFSVLNALKETHLLLTQGAHNQYGDLPWTARHEMLMNQWILARPEMRDFLPTRTMVAYPEAWMDRVEAMNKLQGGTDASVLHYRDLAVFGEQLLLGIRFGSWTRVIEPEQAANWARYWRAEVQGYIHSYRAVTGVDLTQGADASMPAVHLRRRYAYRN